MGFRGASGPLEHIHAHLGRLSNVGSTQKNSTVRRIVEKAPRKRTTRNSALQSFVRPRAIFAPALPT